MNTTLSLYRNRSASGIAPFCVKSHDRRALDVAVRRFPHLLGLCRDFDPADPTIRHLIADRMPQIIAEYHRVIGRRPS